MEQGVYHTMGQSMKRILSKSLPNSSSDVLKLPTQNQLAISGEAIQAHILIMEVIISEWDKL